MWAPERPQVSRRGLVSPNRSNKCVVSSETLDADGQRLAVSVNTLDFEATGESTNLRITVQIVSLVGADMIEGNKSGNTSALENFARHLCGKL